MVDNTTFGNDPSNSGTTASWEFVYQIDENDNGNITAVISAKDSVGNMGNISYNFYEDNIFPTIDLEFYPTTNESSIYLYYLNTTHYAWYGDDMPANATFYVGGNSSSQGGSGLNTTLGIYDNTTFGGDPSNIGSIASWFFEYNITSCMDQLMLLLVLRIM